MSVVIPVYNAAATVESALASIQVQTVEDLQIVIVNDGSTDATSGIVEKLRAQDQRITIINQANAGIVAALNNGLAVCTAEYVARHDADDLARPDRFAQQLAYLVAHPDCVAVSGAVRHIDTDGAILKERAFLPSPDLADPTYCPQIEPYLIHPFLMVRRAAINAVGGYRCVFHAEDTDLYWRLQDVGRLYNMPEILGDYRIHAGSISSKSIVNGRVSSVNSQRAGISTLRRRSGRPDIRFPNEWLVAYEHARSLENMLAIASRDLDEQETATLALSAGLKLLESAGYRPFEVETADCEFIYDASKKWAQTLSPGNKALYGRMVSGAAARLMQGGHLRSAYSLTPLNLYPALIGRFLLRTMMPKYIRRQLQKLAGRDSTFIK